MVEIKPDVEFEPAQLRVLIANDKEEHLELLAKTLTDLGHNVIARETSVQEVAAATARELPDVALVGLGLSAEHALGLTARSPMRLRVLSSHCSLSRTMCTYAKRPGAESSPRSSTRTPTSFAAAIEIALRRFGDYHDVQRAFARRPAIEQAKGILMSRNGISADQAFASLRDHSGRTGTKIVDVAAAIIESHGMLLPTVRSDANGHEPVARGDV